MSWFALTLSAKNQVMDNNDRSIEEAMDSLDQIFHHMHFLMLGLLRLQFYLNRAQEAGEHGKGGKDGKGKGKTNGGKGKEKGYGKGGSPNLRSIAIAPTLPQEPPF